MFYPSSGRKIYDQIKQNKFLQKNIQTIAGT